MFVVQIKNNETDEIEYQSKPCSERRADKIEDGMNINLDHEHFYTDVVVVANGDQTVTEAGNG
jgi:hypothetical protein